MITWRSDPIGGLAAAMLGVFLRATGAGTNWPIWSREFYENCVCAKLLPGPATIKRLIAAMTLLGISSEELVTDSSVADAMRKPEKRRHAVGVRFLRLDKHCESLSARLNAGYNTLPGAEFERLRNANMLLGNEAFWMKEYRASLEHSIRDLARSSKLFRLQPKKLEIPLSEENEIESCDATMFTDEIEQELGIIRAPSENRAALLESLI